MAPLPSPVIAPCQRFLDTVHENTVIMASAAGGGMAARKAEAPPVSRRSFAFQRVSGLPPPAILMTVIVNIAHAVVVIGMNADAQGPHAKQTWRVEFSVTDPAMTIDRER
jgi:hypothetical protein